jgi:hypothetical protein
VTASPRRYGGAADDDEARQLVPTVLAHFVANHTTHGSAANDAQRAAASQHGATYGADAGTNRRIPVCPGHIAAGAEATSQRNNCHYLYKCIHDQTLLLFVG